MDGGAAAGVGDTGVCMGGGVLLEPPHESVSSNPAITSQLCVLNIVNAPTVDAIPSVTRYVYRYNATKEHGILGYALFNAVRWFRWNSDVCCLQVCDFYRKSSV
mgnify:CR=1 FL=1